MSDAIDDVLGTDDSARARSVVDGVWVQSSVSQLKDASLCLLKWYYGKVLRYPKKPPTKGLAIGNKGHGELEAWLKTGSHTPCALGELARAGLPYLPSPHRDPSRPNTDRLLIEHRFDGKKKGETFDPKTAILKAGGVPLDGYIDIVNGRLITFGGPLWPNGPSIPPGTLVLTDHKFSKNIESTDNGGWAALPEHLTDVRFEHGIQMVGYAEWARLMLESGKFPHFDRVVLQHLYYNNGLGSEKVPRCRPVWTTVDLDHVEKEWFKVNHLARTVVDVAKETDPLKIPFNEAACEQYGGCDFANVCPRSPLNRYLQDPGKEEDTMSILDTMFGAAPQVTPNVQGGFPPPPPPAPPMQAQIAAPAAAMTIPQAPLPTVAPPVSDAPLAPGWIFVEQATPGQSYFIQAYGKTMQYVGNGPDGTPFLNTGDQRGNVPLSKKTHAFPIALPPAPPVAVPGTAVVGVGSDGRPLPAVLPPDAPASNPLNSSTPTVVAAPAAPAPTADEKAAEKARKKAEKEAAKAAKAAAPPAPVLPAFPTGITPTLPLLPTPPAQIQIPVIAGPLAGTTVIVNPITGDGLTKPTDVNTVTGLASANGFAGIRLFLGCRPDAGSVRLDDYIEALKNKMCAKYGVKDPRISPRNGTGAKDKDHPLAFDGWKGILASVVALAPPPPGAYHFSERSDFGDVIVPALAALLPPENVVRAG